MIKDVVKFFIGPTSKKRFRTVVQVLVLLMSIVSAGEIYIHFFGGVSFDLSVGQLIPSIFNPRTITWLLLFSAMYFAIYPTIAFLVIVIYRFFNNPGKRLLNQDNEHLNKGMEIIGLLEHLRVLDKLTSRKKKKLYLDLIGETLSEELEWIESMALLSEVLLQAAICYKVFFNGSIALLIICICSIVAILLIIFGTFPAIFTSLRTTLDNQFQEFSVKPDLNIESQIRNDVSLEGQ